ncbi:ribbon-helix-helix protein, CopG family [Candidatus Peregrinibacteria bacterium]|nr:ribbon-helix-helix protein, CopG family [Candidatus Peregrinibacteria bacterium]
MTILKSFRIEEELIRFLEKSAKERGVSQATIIEEALAGMMEETEQWERDLEIIASDEKYQKEQEEIAEEFIEDIYED